MTTAIDDAFARWDRAHLHEFTLADSQRIGRPDPDFDTTDQVLDDRHVTLSRLRAGKQFVHVFDFGDDWTHLCTVGDRRIVRRRPSASSPRSRCRSLAGVSCPINTDAAGAAMTASRLTCPIRAPATYPTTALVGTGPGSWIAREPPEHPGTVTSTGCTPGRRDRDVSPETNVEGLLGEPMTCHASVQRCT